MNSLKFGWSVLLIRTLRYWLSLHDVPFCKVCYRWYRICFKYPLKALTLPGCTCVTLMLSQMPVGVSASNPCTLRTCTPFGPSPYNTHKSKHTAHTESYTWHGQYIHMAHTGSYTWYTEDIHMAYTIRVPVHTGSYTRFTQDDTHCTFVIMHMAWPIHT